MREEVKFTIRKLTWEFNKSYFIKFNIFWKFGKGIKKNERKKEKKTWICKIIWKYRFKNWTRSWTNISNKLINTIWSCWKNCIFSWTCRKRFEIKTCNRYSFINFINLFKIFIFLFEEFISGFDWCLKYLSFIWSKKNFSSWSFSSFCFVPSNWFNDNSL